MIENAIYSKKEADIVFIGLDYYGTCGEQGNGPTLIRQALNSLSSYDIKTRKDAFDKLKICDAGDIKAKNYEELKNKLKIDFKGTPIIMGGEHLITLPVIEALKPENVLIFDAHADYYDTYKGEKYSYATVTRRISEITSKVVVAGVRDLTQEEALSDFKNVKVLQDIKEVPRIINKGEWYVSIDLDVLDPSHCPEVSTPVPRGVSYEALVKVLNNLCINHRITGLDVVELTAKTRGLSSINAGGIIMNYLKRRCE